MKLVTKDEKYTSDATYWLLIGKTGSTYQYILLGRWFPESGFEFNHDKFKRGYVYREDMPELLANLR
jgi:hypothetical protein